VWSGDCPSVCKGGTGVGSTRVGELRLVFGFYFLFFFFFYF
jgi:hypothetical protein